MTTTTMLSWKDKVTEKISRLFSDSPSSTSPTLDQPQARSYSREGKSLSSIFSFILPSASFGGFRSNKYRHDIEPIQSLPVRWNSRSVSWRDKPLDSYEECNPKFENKETLNSHEEDGKNGSGRNKGALNAHEEYRDHDSGRSTSSSDMFEDATDPHNMEKSMPYLTEDSSFISSDLYEFLQSSLPNIVKGCQWVLLYGTIKHGISLRTLIRKSADLSGPCFLIVGDMQGAVFGGLLECPLKPTAKRKYQGTNQTFVFTTIYGEPRIFRPTGANRYFYLCLNDLLALGGGGNFALSLDGDLLTGTSGPCETFGNLCLAHSQEFELKNVELWGFTHSSQYLT
uniref:Putative oxidation resistance protein 1 n=1 Tax=Davidia involucrata TaxID=16924 RepID=A0A5B6Z3D4_DAVIN